MKNLLYMVAGLLVVLWSILFLGYNANGSVHFLVVVAFFLLLLRIFNNRKLARSMEDKSSMHSPFKQGKIVNMSNHGRIKIIPKHPKQ